MVAPHKPEEHRHPVPEVREHAAERVDERAAERVDAEAERSRRFRRRDFHEHFEREVRDVREIVDERGDFVRDRIDERADERADAAADANAEERL
jgi:hypothetical protein